MSNRTRKNRVKDAFNPFPGMRSYSMEEAGYYSYDKEVLQESLTKLMDHQFLALFGTNGSGKASFVNCAILPALIKDRIPGKGGDTWDYLIMRPGTTPIWNLAYELTNCAAFENSEKRDVDSVLSIEKLLSENVSGLLELFENYPLKRGRNLFIFVKNLEDLFVFKELYKDRECTTKFINLILKFLSKRSYPVYFCFSISSDIQREAASFPGLLEVINKGTILLPEINGDQFLHLFSEGIRKARVKEEPGLSAQMLEDFEHYLPGNYEAQHVLNVLMYEWASTAAEDDELKIQHYRRIGTLYHALDQSAEYVYRLLTNKQKSICEWIFRTITQIGVNQRRRGVSIGDLSKIARCSSDEVIEVIEKFNSFYVYLIEQVETMDMEYRLTAFDELVDELFSSLNSHSIVTIKSLRLVNGWKRLHQWVQLEQKYAGVYQQLVGYALAHTTFDENGHRKKGFLVDQELQQVREWHEEDQPSTTWAARYSPHFEEAIDYLESSVKDQRKKKRREELRTKLSEGRRKTILVGAIVLSVVFCIVGVFIGSLLIKEKKASELLRIKGLKIDYFQDLDSLRVLYMNSLQDIDSAQIDLMRAGAIRYQAANHRADSMLAYVKRIILKDSLCKRSIRMTISALRNDLDSAKTNWEAMSDEEIQGRIAELRSHDFCDILHNQCLDQLAYFEAAETICERREEE
ncbi:MAG: hypothetical protein AAGA66_02615 [Bacteroidota bacterium]